VQAACTAGAAHEDDGVPRVVPRATATATRWRLVHATEEVAGGSAGSSALYAKPRRVVPFLLRCMRPDGHLGINPAKMKLGHIKPANTNIDHTNRIVLAYPIFQAFRNQRDLLAIHFLNDPGRAIVTYQVLFDIPRRSLSYGPMRCCAIVPLPRWAISPVPHFVLELRRRSRIAAPNGD
jgi:hypothetical protein